MSLRIVLLKWSVVLSVIHFSVLQKFVIVGCATFLETFLTALVFHIVTARLEEAVKALVHEVVQRGMVVGGFQEIIDRLENVLVRTIPCQYTTAVRKHTAFTLFLEIAVEIVCFRLEQDMPIVIDDVFQKPYAAEFFFLSAVMRGEAVGVSARVVTPIKNLDIEHALKCVQRVAVIVAPRILKGA